jgi:outer membrane protein OmpA-like peptidoglycan-associated protein
MRPAFAFSGFRMGELDMRKATRSAAVFAAALIGATMLAGCGSLSRGIAKDGSGARQLVWPRPADTNPLHRGGTYPDLDDLRQVQAGLTKNQIIALIGPPHFNEGFAGVHEWNYLLNLRGKDDAVTQCEYKILFDEHMLARSFHWQPASCADFLKPPASTPVVQRFELSTDALFAFDRFALSDIKPDGRAQLDALAEKLVEPRVKSEHIRVIGYTDRLGSAAYNQELSQRRAASVRDYLVGKGISADRIDAEGRGEVNPVKACDDADRPTLIACLAPNRRVVVEAEGMH